MSTTMAGGRAIGPVRSGQVGGSERAARSVRPHASWVLLGSTVCIGLAAGFLSTGHAVSASAVAASGTELTRLLRAMAMLKMLLVAGCLAGMAWRLGEAVGPGRLAGYLIAAGAMAAGPGLIWDMAHLGWGALLLHGGLALGVVVLWTDPGMGRRLEDAIGRRRASLRVRQRGM